MATPPLVFPFLLLLVRWTLVCPSSTERVVAGRKVLFRSSTSTRTFLLLSLPPSLAHLESLRQTNKTPFHSHRLSSHRWDDFQHFLHSPSKSSLNNRPSTSHSFLEVDLIKFAPSTYQQKNYFLLLAKSCFAKKNRLLPSFTPTHT